MNSLMNYFSPTKTEPSPIKVIATPSTSKEHQTPSNSKNGAKHKTPKSAKADSRQIVSNMESVINSVNRKHRHRKKKENNVELNKSEPEITDISNILNSSLTFISPNVSLENGKNTIPESKENIVNNHVKRARGRPKKIVVKVPRSSIDSKAVEDEKTPKALEKSFLTPKNDSQDNIALAETSQGGVSNEDKLEVKVDSNGSGTKSTPTTNAFTLLMNARNRVIGSNQSGQEIALQDASPTSNPEKVKRKLMLQEWADKKGGAKRKLVEVEREEYIEQQMEKRAKRLKRMLVPEDNSAKTKKPMNNRTKVLSEAQDLDNALVISSSPDSLIEEDQKVVKQKDVKAKLKKQNVISVQDISTPNKTPTKKSLPTSTVCRRNRTKRISSTQSERSTNDSDDIEFVQKLSSPIKKRDSLLGYFPKVISPKDDDVLKSKVKRVEIEPTTGTPSRKQSRKVKTAVNEDVPQPENLVVEIDSHSGRPRRSCAPRIRYDEEFYTSPKKEEKVRNKKHTSSSLHVKSRDNKSNNSDNEDVICLDTTDETITNKKVSKLAPVFIKNVPKPAIDPALLEAKKNFLMSGIPEKMKLEIAKQKQFEESFEISLESMFPKISHVGCDDETRMEAYRNADWGKCGVFWREMTNSPDRPKKSNDDSTLNPFTPIKDPLTALEKLEDVENKLDLVKSLKIAYAKFPTYRCYKQLRAKYKLTKNMAVQQVSDSIVILNSNNMVKEDIREPSVNGELMFTEKYKPMSSDQVLVNFSPVNKLKDFLSNWQNGRFSKMNESSNDFDMSNDSFSSTSTISNAVVLHGPSSSGKTNAVFALANEMNFNVLEINAGMKRNGKKLLQELQEATQSHLVNNDKSSLLKRSFNGLKAKDTEGNDSSSVSELSSSAKLSLILVEDADIVFEQDSGFIEAIHQLVATSKRPVIVVSNNAECPHLTRIQKQFNIEFPAPNVLNISKFLSLISLVENCPVELDDIIRLYLFNQENLRKTLLEMQFFIQSGGDRKRQISVMTRLQSPRKFLKEDTSEASENVPDDSESMYKPISMDAYTHQTLFDFYTHNQNSDYIVQFPVDFECLYLNVGDIFASFKKLPQKVAKKGRKLKKSPQKLAQSVPSLDDIVMFYENVSLASYITPSDRGDCLSENLQETISHTIVEKTIRSKANNNLDLDLSLSKKHKRSKLAQLLPQNCIRTTRSADLDYEPLLRSICRHEKNRASVERRGSRFYHYLRNICTNTNNFSSIEFDNTCSILNCSTIDNDALNCDN